MKFKKYQDSIQYVDELRQMANDISRGKLDYSVDKIFKTPHITKKQRDKFSKVEEWKWMKYEGIGPQINPSGEISPRGKCQAKSPYKDKECYLFSDILSTSYGEIECVPMCFYCFNNFRDDMNF